MKELEHKETELVETKDLIPYSNNPKEHPEEQIDEIASSIKSYGFIQPIVTDGEQEIIIGHGRLQAAKKLGLEQVPVIKHDELTEAEAKALRLADNKIAESGWQDEKLAVELEQLTEENDFEELITGFNEDELSEYLDSLTDEEDLEEPETEDPEKIETDIQEGEVFKLGQHRLMCGDATNEEHVKTLMDGKEAAITFTSPPYNLGDTESLSGNTNFEDSKYKNQDDNFTPEQWKELVKNSIDTIKPFSQYQFYNIQQLAPNKRVFIDLLADYRDNFADMIIWDKQTTAPARGANVMNSCFEYIIILGEESANRAIDTAQLMDASNKIDNVIRAQGQKNNEYSEHHAATFPLHLPEHIIKNFTKRGDVVIDNFAGTGTTLIAAEQLDRKAYCIDLEPEYCQIIINRWEELTGKEHEVIET